MSEPASRVRGHADATKRLTIVMYHYVRPLASSRYPAIKALELADFRRQLAYCQRHYQFVSMEEVVAAAEGGEPLPDRPLLLTFDDGYSDHYLHAWPALREAGARGAFYPTSDAVLEHRMLDVNKIHFIMAAIPDHDLLLNALEEAIRERGAAAGAASVEDYRQRYWAANRFDTPAVLYCKQLLQHALPDAFRRQLVDEFFKRFVTADEQSFAADLYVNVAQLQEMRSDGMHIGGHGGSHRWLDRLTPEDQRREIESSVNLLETVGTSNGDCLTFCYPYGGYNAVTVDLLRQRGFRAGLTVVPDLARLDPANMLELSRIDTTDLPRDPDAPPGRWTELAGTATDAPSV